MKKKITHFYAFKHCLLAMVWFVGLVLHGGDVRGQYYYEAETTSFVGCNLSTQTCSVQLSGGSTSIKGKVAITGTGSNSVGAFTIQRCNNANFTVSGTYYVKKAGTAGVGNGSPCDNSIPSGVNVNVGDANKVFNVDLDANQLTFNSPVEYHTVLVPTTGNGYYAGIIRITKWMTTPTTSSPSSGSTVCSPVSFTYNNQDPNNQLSSANEVRLHISTSSGFLTSSGLSNPNIYNNDFTGQTTGTNTTSSISLSPGTYYWSVRVGNGIGQSKFTSPVQFTVISAPSTPTTISSPSATENSIDLNWSTVANATSYRVLDCSDNSIEYNGSNNSTTINNLTANNGYSYKVRATNSCGSSAYTSCTNNVYTYPSPPNNPNPPGGGCNNPTIYQNGPTQNNVTYWWQGTTCGTLMNNSSSSYNAPSNNTYFLRAQGNTSGLWSQGCGQVTVTNIILYPTAVSGTPTVTGSTSSSISLSWNAASNVDYYEIINCATNATTVISPPTTTGTVSGLNYNTSYQFKVRAVNSCGPGTASGCTSPTITPCSQATASTPAPATVTLPATTASFTVNATGSGTLSYVWWQNIGGTWNQLTNASPNTWTSGATSSTLSLTGITSVMNGRQYRCVVTAGCGTPATSGAGLLTVGCNATNITTQPVVPSVNLPSVTSTSVSVSATGSSLTYQWQVNTGSGFTNISNNSTYAGATLATLTISGITYAMNGYSYRCVVSNACSASTNTNSSTLTIGCTTTSITTQPVSPNVNLPSVTSTSISVTATGASLTYQWQVNTGSGFTNISNNSTYAGATLSTLTISGITTTMNSYSYRCVVGNACSASVNTNPVTLGVSSITVTAPNTAQTFSVGQSTTITWSSTNLATNAPISIQVVPCSSTTAVATLADGTLTGTDNTPQNFTWNNIALAPGTYRIKIYQTGLPSNNAIVDYSDACFTIVPANPSTPTIPGNPTVNCNNATLQAAGPIANGVQYYWQGINTTNCTSQNTNLGGGAVTASNIAQPSGQYTASANGTYCIRARDIASGLWSAGCGCVNVGNIAPSPTATVGASSPVTTGSTILLTSTASNTPATYSWTGPNGFTSTQQNPQIPNATQSMSGQYTVVVTANGCSSGLYGINVVVNPPTPLIVSGLQVFGDVIPPGSGSRTASGNVTLAPVGCLTQNLRFSGSVTGDPPNNTISGNCQMYLNSVQGYSGTFGLFNGPFNFNVSGTVMQGTVNNLINNHLYKMANLGLQYDDIDVSCDGVLINGTLRFPYWLRKVLSNGLFDFDASINQLSIKQTTGVQYAGNISVSDLKFKNVLEIDDIDFTFNTIQDKFSGSIGFTTPLITWPLNNFGASATVQNGKLNALALSLSGSTGIILGTSGLKLMSLSGGFDHLTDTNPLEIFAAADLQPVVPIDLTAVSNLNLSFRYTHNLSALGSGVMSLFNQNVAGLDAELWINQVKFSAFIDLMTIVKGSADFSVYKPALSPVIIQGNSSLGLYVPSGNLPTFIDLAIAAAGLTQGEEIASAQTYLTNNFIAGKTSIPSSLAPKIYIKLAWAGGTLHPTWDLNYNSNVSLIAWATGSNVISANLNQPLSYSAISPGIKSFSVETAPENILVEAKASSFFPNIEIYKADGDSVNAGNISQFTDVAYQYDANTGIGVYVLKNPKVGDYQIQVSNTDSLQIRRSNMSPFAVITSVQQDTTNKTLTIKWKDTDPDHNARVSLGFDDNCKNADGRIFYTGNENDTNDTFIWNYSSELTGKYYVYVITKDTNDQINSYYYDQAFELISANAPNKVSNFQVAFGDTSIHLQFTGVNHFMNSYLVYYANKPNTVDYHSQAFSIGDTLAFDVSSLIPGRYYEFMVTSIDTLNHQSKRSNIVGGVWQSNTRNNVPFFNQSPDSIIHFDVNQNSLYAFPAADLDADPLQYSILQAPSGLIINSTTGQISWTPTQAEKGYHRLKILVSDGNGGKDSLKLVCQVFDTINSYADVEFNKILFLNFNDEGIAIVSDPEFSGSQSKKDSIMVNLFSNSDLVGLNFWVEETSVNSHEFMTDFELTPNTSTGKKIKVSSGDTIWIKYFDQSRNLINTDYAYFAEFNSYFEFQDSICGNDTVRFQNKSFYSNSNFLWNFGDGSATTNIKHPKHSYPLLYGNNLNGNSFDKYLVTLTVYDDEGRLSFYADTVTVARMPISNLSATYSGCGQVSVGGNSIADSFQWSSGQTTSSILVSQSGTYYLELINLNLCTLSTSTSVTVHSIPPPPSIPDLASLYCSDAANISLTGSPASGTFSGANVSGNSFSVSAAGVGTHPITYTYTDANTCSNSITDTVLVVANPQFDVLVTNTSCAEENGILSVNPGFTSYLWSGGQTDNSISNLSAGSYTVTVTDTNGCSTAETKTVSSSTLPTVVLNSTNPGCGLSNGQINTTASLGVAPYSYLWTSGQTSANVSNLPSGSYGVTVTDAQGCETTQSLDLQEPPRPILTTNGATATCGQTNGSASVTATGGQLPYTYSWNTGANTAAINNLSVGIYSVTVTDNIGCQADTTINISSTDGPTVTASSSPTNCDENTGTASVSVVGNNPPYAYVWSNSQITEEIINLQSGTYTVTVTDANSCVTIETVTVMQQPNPNAPIITINGSQLESSLANEYQWFLNGQEIVGANQQTYTPTENGDYSVQITDGNGCQSNSEEVPFSIITGINSKTPSALQAKLYPNPNNGQFIFSCSGNPNETLTLEILDVTARLIFTSTFTTSEKGLKEHINLSVSSGIYHVQIKTSSNFEILQLLIE